MVAVTDRLKAMVVSKLISHSFLAQHACTAAEYLLLAALTSVYSSVMVNGNLMACSLYFLAKADSGGLYMVFIRG